MHRVASPVVFHKGGFRAIHQGEGVFGWLVPLDGIDAVGAIVVAGDDDAADELFGALVLEVLLALLVQQVPGRQQGPKVTFFPFSVSTERPHTLFWPFLVKQKGQRKGKIISVYK